jgi:hypothetical protein
MEYHSFIDSDGKYIGKTKYTKGEHIPLPPEEVIEDIRYINHKWRCILPKVKQERAYDEFYLNRLKNYVKIDDTLLQLEVFCKKNKIMPELKIKEDEFNDLTSDQQKIVIRSIIEHGFDDVVFTKDNNAYTQIKCRNYFTYNYNTKKREYNKIHFRKNTKYDLDLKFNIYVGNKINLEKMTYEANCFDKKQNEYAVRVAIEFPDIGCNANCWYCHQHQNLITPNNYNIANEIIDTVDKIVEIAKHTGTNIDLQFLGGEITTLSKDAQEKIAKKIDELIEDDYPCVIFTNGIIKDAPILNTKAYYMVHAIEWKNKVLPKLGNNAEYIIIFTEKDTEDDIKKFMKLNPDIRVFPFAPEKNLKIDTVPIVKRRFNASFKDERHKIYSCRRKTFMGRRSMVVEIRKNGEKNVYYCCRKMNKIPFKDLKNFDFPDIICPKKCNGV